jgi:hypothetical protein
MRSPRTREPESVNEWESEGGDGCCGESGEAAIVGVLKGDLSLVFSGGLSIFYSLLL